jgi:hypothetical protein
MDPWLDEEKLLPGQDWQHEIPAAVRAADVVLVCLSGLSINKEGYIQKEIRSALDIAEEKPDGVIYLVPVKLEECFVPERLSKWQWVNLFERTGYQRLLGALNMRAQTLQDRGQVVNEAKTTTLAETENYLIWQAVEPDKEITYHIELGNVTDHFFREEWYEFLELVKSLELEPPDQSQNKKASAEPITKTLAETENYLVWKAEEPDGETTFHVELGNVTVHFFKEEWDEFLELVRSLG